MLNYLFGIRSLRNRNKGVTAPKFWQCKWWKPLIPATVAQNFLTNALAPCPTNNTMLFVRISLQIYLGILVFSYKLFFTLCCCLLFTFWSHFWCKDIWTITEETNNNWNASTEDGGFFCIVWYPPLSQTRAYKILSTFNT